MIWRNCADCMPRTLAAQLSLLHRGTSMPHSLHTLMADDHGRLDALFAACADAAEKPDMQGVVPALRSARQALEQHMHAEESVLFPTLIQRGIFGPANLMHLEHQRIGQLLEYLTLRAATGDRAGFASQLAELRGVLALHHYKEETILYPLARHLLGDINLQLCAQMQDIIHLSPHRFAHSGRV